MCPICSINLNNFITPIPYNYIPPKKAQSQQAHCGLAESMLQPLLSHNSCLRSVNKMQWVVAMWDSAGTCAWRQPQGTLSMKNQPKEILPADLWWLEQRRSFQGQVREDGRHIFPSAYVITQKVRAQIPLVAAVFYPEYQLAATYLGLLLTATLGERLLPF